MIGQITFRTVWESDRELNYTDCVPPTTHSLSMLARHYIARSPVRWLPRTLSRCIYANSVRTGHEPPMSTWIAPKVKSNIQSVIRHNSGCLANLCYGEISRHAALCSTDIIIGSHHGHNTGRTVATRVRLEMTKEWGPAYSCVEHRESTATGANMV